jgi:hypothetical protein
MLSEDLSQNKRNPDIYLHNRNKSILLLQEQGAISQDPRQHIRKNIILLPATTPSTLPQTTQQKSSTKTIRHPTERGKDVYLKL